MFQGRSKVRCVLPIWPYVHVQKNSEWLVVHVWLVGLGVTQQVRCSVRCAAAALCRRLLGAGKLPAQLGELGPPRCSVWIPVSHSHLDGVRYQGRHCSGLGMLVVDISLRTN